MEEAGGGESSRYWCHMCSQRVDPIREIEAMKCPVCESGFVEEIMANDSSPPSSVDVGDRALSLWAPILLGMMANPIRYRSLRAPTEELEEEGHNNNNNNSNNGDGDEQGHEHLQEEEEDQEVVEEEQEEEEMRMRRRRRRTSAAAILQLLQSIRAGMVLENQEREGVILINPLSQTIIVHGGERPPPVLGLGLGLELLLQHLAENDPNRYGTPPANREAVEGLPTVQIEEEAMQCAVCLDECEVGALVKEMPCKHKFHSTCIVPWLQLHSSCPVCRYQLPSHDSSSPKDNDDNDNNRNINAIAAPPFSLPQLLWPLTTLFSSSTSQAPTPTASLTYPHRHPLPSPSPSPSGDDAPPTTSSPHAAHHN